MFVLLAYPVLAVVGGRRLAGGPRGGRGLRAVYVLTCAALPFLLPAEVRFLRGVAACFSVTLALKVLLVHREGAAPRRWPLPRLLLWMLLPPDTRPATSTWETTATRAAGVGRFRRLLLKATILGLLALTPALPAPLATARTLARFYLVLSGFADLLAIPLLLTGIRVAEVFDAPFLATSPRDFWSHRWNHFVADVARHEIYPRVGGRRRRVVAVVVVFAASGLMHEYLMQACLPGWHAHVGWMFAFFMIHGASVLVHGAWANLVARRQLPPIPAPAAWALHTAWFVTTAPLFVAPMVAASGFDRWPL